MTTSRWPFPPSTLYNRLGHVNITAISEKVAADIQIAKTWQPHTTLKDDGNRGGAEKGFR